MAEADANIAAVDLQHWVETAPDRLEESEVKAGELYMIKLEQDNFPHEFKVGLGRCKSKPAQGEYPVTWFQRCSRTFSWSTHPKFKEYSSADSVPPESFLLHVSDKELTAKGRQEKATNPCLNSLFMKRLRAFCAAKGLVVAEGEQLQRAGGGAGQGRSGGGRGGDGLRMQCVLDRPPSAASLEGL